jgi:hypothetical protein
MAETTLQLYKEQERLLAARGARHGFRVHGVVTLVVIAALVAINVLIAPEFPWSAFAAAGMLLGLFFHWYFGVHRGDEFVQRHQMDVEREVERRAA